MLNRLRNREAGFTLIELLVVILIIGILIAVAAPSFLGQQTKAHTSAILQQEAVAYQDAKSAAVSNTTNPGSYPAAATLATDINKSEPGISISACTTNASGDFVFPAAGSLCVGTASSTADPLEGNIFFLGTDTNGTSQAAYSVVAGQVSQCDNSTGANNACGSGTSTTTIAAATT